MASWRSGLSASLRQSSRSTARTPAASVAWSKRSRCSRLRSAHSSEGTPIVASAEKETAGSRVEEVGGYGRRRDWRAPESAVEGGEKDWEGEGGGWWRRGARRGRRALRLRREKEVAV
eukprot:scaffold24780_cov30-Tisochrysis_lutea.AAC.2